MSPEKSASSSVPKQSEKKTYTGLNVREKVKSFLSKAKETVQSLPEVTERLSKKGKEIWSRVIAKSTESSGQNESAISRKFKLVMNETLLSRNSDKIKSLDKKINLRNSEIEKLTRTLTRQYSEYSSDPVKLKEMIDSNPQMKKFIIEKQVQEDKKTHSQKKRDGYTSNVNAINENYEKKKEAIEAKKNEEIVKKEKELAAAKERLDLARKSIVASILRSNSFVSKLNSLSKFNVVGRLKYAEVIKRHSKISGELEKKYNEVKSKVDLLEGEIKKMKSELKNPVNATKQTETYTVQPAAVIGTEKVLKDPEILGFLTEWNQEFSTEITDGKLKKIDQNFDAQPLVPDKNNVTKDQLRNVFLTQLNGNTDNPELVKKVIDFVNTIK